MTHLSWSPGQDKALKDVAEWFRTCHRTKKQVYRMFGFAGTGKTSMAKQISEDLTGGSAQFMAYTGKAASVLQSKGCTGADTIHGQIYTPKEKSKQRLRDLEARIARTLAERERGAIPQALADRELAKMERELEAEKKNALRPMWAVNPDSAIKDKPLLIVDEVSMVGDREGEDLLSYGVPVLVLGDPAQLPPVMGGGFFTSCKPDTMLTEIHRQAKDDPIIRLATIVREGGHLKPGDYGRSRVIDKSLLKPGMVTSCDQLLVGRNNTRRGSNKRIRTLLGHESLHPVAGERLVCLRNNREFGLLNGALYRTTEDAQDAGDDKLTISIEPDEGGSQVIVDAHRPIFEGGEVPWYDKKDAEEFDYGYALTVHKSQGSQWKNVVLFDEWHQMDSRRQWLYTGITRAAEQVTIVQGL